MGNHSSNLTPPNAQERQPEPGSQAAYASVRVVPNMIGGRIVANPNAAGGGPAHRSSWSPPPPRPMTVVQKTKMVKNTCHVRKDTIRLTRSTAVGVRYHLSFRFDADVPCKVAVYFVANEGKDAHGRLSYTPRLPNDDDWIVGPHRFDAGANQAYSTQGMGHEGADLDEAKWTLKKEEKEKGKAKGKGKEGEMLVYIVLSPAGPTVEAGGGGGSSTGTGTEEGRGKGGGGEGGGEVNSQITVLRVEPKGSGGEGEELTARVLKQKIETPDGVFVLQEIYGIAGTTTTSSPSTTTTNTDGSTTTGTAQDEDPSLSECVVCLTNKRELAILPCRHMCVCRTCAAECIRSQDSRCPICRNPAQALLKLTMDEDDRHAHAQVHA